MSDSRTFAVGDIHGDSAALDTLLERLPPLTADDTVLFIGDYVDRGPDPRGVVERVRAFPQRTPAKVITLRGNHEDKWVESWKEPDAAFLIQTGNGCGATFRSYTGGAPLGAEERLPGPELAQMIEVRGWLPAEVHDWMAALPLWYEDDHAVYVHAGLEGEGTVWKHPRDCAPKPLLWMREDDFFQGYEGKRLVFGHTPVTELPPPKGLFAKLFDDPKDVWLRGPLIGIDTGCGKGGFLSAVELPAMRVYESR
ncbi:MAG TPA: metallophosphoesterase family protein [Myxococcota bacterium]|nr:metallophosphoesterase family protein [Myxococcota bacterium]